MDLFHVVHFSFNQKFWFGWNLWYKRSRWNKKAMKQARIQTQFFLSKSLIRRLSTHWFWNIIDKQCKQEGSLYVIFSLHTPCAGLCICAVQWDITSVVAGVASVKRGGKGEGGEKRGRLGRRDNNACYENSPLFVSAAPSGRKILTS